MKRPCALVVDDDRDILDDVQERLDAIGHASIAVSCMDDARGHLGQDHRLDYVLLDLEIPTRYGRPPLVQHGLNLLGQVNQLDVKLPVVVMTAHGHDASDIPAEVMRHGRAFDYIRKPFPRPGDKHRTLEAAVRAAFDQRLHALAGDPVPVAPLSAFSGTPRSLVIEEERITLCGVEVWRDCAQDDLRQALLKLAQRTPNGWIRARGTALHQELGRDPSNPISKPIQRFRDACTERMRACLSLDCGKFDVIGQPKGGGYHFTETIQVTAPGLADVPVDAPDARPRATPSEPGLNPYQTWVLARLGAGEILRQKDVIGHFSRDHGELPRRDASSIKRYLRELRGNGLITTGKDKALRRPAGS